MTIIAYRDGILASDSQCATSYGHKTGFVKKIGRGPSGEVFGVCGTGVQAAHLIRWLEGGRVGEISLDDDNTSAVLIECNGEIREYDHKGRYHVINAKFFSLGSGREVAHGAMAHGATALEAVAIAIEHNSGCGGPIQIEAIVPHSDDDGA